MKRYTHIKHRVELTSTGTAPNCKPLLRVFRAGQEKPLFELELGDFCGCAQWFYEGYLRHDLEMQPTSSRYKRLLKRGRRGLGYSYP